MAISLVQTVFGNGTGTSATLWTYSATQASATTTGNLILVSIASDAAQTGGVLSITDTAGNTYTKIYDIFSSQQQSMWYAKNITGNASNVVTPHMNNAGAIAPPTSSRMYVQEWSGLDPSAPLDKFASSANPTSSTTPSVATVATTAPNELVVAAYSPNNNETITAGAGYSNYNGTTTEGTPYFCSIAVESKTVSATGIQTATFGSNPAGTAPIGVATFKAAGLSVDATASVNTGAISSATPNWSHTCSGVNRALFVLAAWSSATTITSVTYNSVGLALVSNSSATNGTLQTAIYRLIAPTTGANTVQINFSGTTNCTAYSYSFTGADQTSPDDGANNAVSTAANSTTVSVTTVADQDYLLDIFMHSAFQATVNASQTVVLPETSNSGGGFTVSGSRLTNVKTPAGAQAMAWTLTNTANNAQSAVAIRPVQTVVASTAHNLILLGVGA